MTMLLVLAILVLACTVAASARGGLRFPPTAEPFTCKVRSPQNPASGKPERWPLRHSRAAWEHDVLLVRRGRLFPRLKVLPVRTAENVVLDAPTTGIGSLGPRPLVITLRLDDGALVEVAASAADRTPLVGPFLAAAIPGLPRGPRGQRNLGR